MEFQLNVLAKTTNWFNYQVQQGLLSVWTSQIHGFGLVPFYHWGIEQLQDILTPDFSTLDLNFKTMNFSTPDTYGIKKFMVEKSGVEMFRLYTLDFNP